MNLFDRFQAGLPMGEFITKHGTPPQAMRWKQTFDTIALTDGQKTLLKSFRREMNVLVLAGVWCGDCSGQCPIYDRFAEVAPSIHVRYIDRDIHADAQRELQVNGGNRVPMVVFFSEDGHEVGRYGERTLSKYRSMMEQYAGASCPTGLVQHDLPLLAQVTQDWLNEFERAEWILRLSPRLRTKHGD